MHKIQLDPNITAMFNEENVLLTNGTDLVTLTPHSAQNLTVFLKECGVIRSVEETRACPNCEETFIQNDGGNHPDGFCCPHCRNRHHGEKCDTPCEYCKDDEQAG